MTSPPDGPNKRLDAIRAFGRRREPSPGLVERERLAARELRAVKTVWIAVLFGPGLSLVLGHSFLVHKSPTPRAWDFSGASLIELVGRSVAWATAVATFLASVAWFVWWRRTAMAFGRAIGALLAVGALLALIVGVASEGGIVLMSGFPVLIGAAAAVAAAFFVAPAPRSREELNELQVKSLVRRHDRRAADRRPETARALERAATRRSAAVRLVIGGVLVGGTPAILIAGHASAARHQGAVMATLAAFAAAPAIFAWWRLGGATFVRVLGVAVAAAGGLGTWICLTLEPWVPRDDRVYANMLLVASAFFVAAFLVAPAPLDPRRFEAMGVRRFVKRHARS